MNRALNSECEEKTGFLSTPPRKFSLARHPWKKKNGVHHRDTEALRNHSLPQIYSEHSSKNVILWNDKTQETG